MDDRGSAPQEQPRTSEAPHVGVAPRDPVVSTVVGDRCCTSCGFNLIGSPIVRESHYSMLIIRCPECGTCAAVQEYPLLGRWARRCTALMAATLLLVLLGVAAASVGLIQAHSPLNNLGQLAGDELRMLMRRGWITAWRLSWLSGSTRNMV